tara:strand:+ start:499 stop:720 length:222 start_codon:yes stop_codon:yes gene_type:complete
MSEPLSIEVILELGEDIKKEEISTYTVNWLCCYDDGITTLKQLRDMEDTYVIEELYHTAESVKRAIKAIDIIF